MMAESKQTRNTGESKELNTEECSPQETKFKQTYENILATMTSVMSKIEYTPGKSREVRLSKMKRLHAVLINSKNKLKIETLRNCMEVLRKLKKKADKVPGKHENFSAERKQGNISDRGELTEISASRDNSQSRVHHVLPKSGTEHNSPNLQTGKRNSSELSHANDEASPNSEILPYHKNSRALQHMLALDSLRNLYKCMDKECSLTENSARSFLNHLRDEHCHKKNSDWNYCSYCPFQGDGTPYDLVHHITKKHGHCQYQCAYCFFRGMTHSCVALHQKADHSNKVVNVILCKDLKAKQPAESEVESFSSVVQPYICNQGSCDKTFSNSRDYLLHLQWHNQASALNCHTCKATCSKAAHLLCQSATGHAVNQQNTVDLDQPVLGDVVSRPSESTLATGRAVISLRCKMSTKEGSADTNRAVPFLFNQVTQRDINDTMQNASFQTVESEVGGAVQKSAVSPSLQNYSLPESAPLQSPKVSSSLQETNVKGAFPGNSLFREQDTDIIHNSDEGGLVADEDLQELYYQLATEGKLCNLMTRQGDSKLSESQQGRESPVKLKNSVSELIRESDSQNLSDLVIVETKSCLGAAVEEETGLSQVHTTSRDGLVTAPKGVSTEVSIQNADSGSDIDSKSETSLFSEPVTTVYGADKPQTVQASEEPAASEDNVARGDGQKQFTVSGLTGKDLYLCGNARCDYRVATASQLREHLYVCDLSREGVLECPHCSRPFKGFKRLVNHLRLHGVPRYSCALCSYRATAPTAVERHLKQQHKVFCTETAPVDRLLNNHDTDMFVVSPKGCFLHVQFSVAWPGVQSSSSRVILTPNGTATNVVHKEVPQLVCSFIPEDQEKEKLKSNSTGCLVKTIYRPEERHLLPVTAILKEPIQCALCPFKTKVRINMQRHLDLHLDSTVDTADIPTVELVSPVPCLEWDGKLFDEMTNVAVSSAVTVGEANDGQPARRQYVVPQYVEESRRYMCSAGGCCYLSCSKTMLQLHIRVLHKDEAVYHCPHCPPPAPEIPLAGMGAHLRMHGDRLYGCSDCPYFHFLLHIVERHLVDRHPGKTAFVTVLRERDATEAETATDSTSLGAISSSGNSGKEVQYPNFPCIPQPKKRTAALRAMKSLQTSLPDWSEPVPSASSSPPPEGSHTEEPGLGQRQAFTSSPDQKKKNTSKETKIPCMDCGKKCINVRGLKLHIRKTHLCTAKWLCGYCYQGRSSEMSIKYHCSLRHQGLPELVKYNEEAAAVNLDDDFWETNYGLPRKTVTTASSPSSALQSESSSEESESQEELPELMATEEAHHYKQNSHPSTQLRLHNEAAKTTAHHYACSKCSFVALVLDILRRHFETEHNDSDFCYIVKPSKLPSDENENVIVRTETDASNFLSTSSPLLDACNNGGSSCGTSTDSEEQFHSDHHSKHHPMVEAKYCVETVSYEAKRAKFECPSCSFVSDNSDILKEHLECHMKPSRHGPGAQQCDLETEVVSHCQSSHVDCDGIVANMSELEMEDVEGFVIEWDVVDDERWSPAEPVPGKKGLLRFPRKIQNVARMSTALSAVSARPLIKSLSAKMSEENFTDSSESDESDDPGIESPYSYYGRPPSPVDENRLLASATYGDSVIRLNLSAFNKIYNIYPQVKVHDLRLQKLVPI